MPAKRSPAASDAIVQFADQQAWADWLAAHHATATGLWLRLAKKGSPEGTVSYAEALEIALCYGWIDAQKRGESDHTWLQRFMPRTAASIWSKINREKALALIAAGRMQPAGRREVERAQADGRWEQAYDSPRTAAVPADLQEALESSPAARSFFGKLSGANRYAVLWRIQTAKKPATRTKRIRDLVDMLARGETIHPQKRDD